MEQQERGLYVAGGTMSLILIAGDSNKITTLLRLCGYYQRFGKSLCLYFYGNKKEWSYTVSDGLEFVSPEVHMAGSSVTLVSTLHPKDGGNMCLRKL